MYDAKVASLRDHDYDLRRIWTLKEAHQLQKEIWDYQCPQCWTPCEANQSLMGNLFGLRNAKRGAKPVKKAPQLVQIKPVISKRTEG
jgi:hypothetical protein